MKVHTLSHSLERHLNSLLKAYGYSNIPSHSIYAYYHNKSTFDMFIYSYNSFFFYVILSLHKSAIKPRISLLVPWSIKSWTFLSVTSFIRNGFGEMNFFSIWFEPGSLITIDWTIVFYCVKSNLSISREESVMKSIQKRLQLFSILLCGFGPNRIILYFCMRAQLNAP